MKKITKNIGKASKLSIRPKIEHPLSEVGLKRAYSNQRKININPDDLNGIT